MQEQAYTVGSTHYNHVACNLIDEIIGIIDTSEFFHLGLEEEDYASQRSQPVAVIRNPAKKLEDATYLFDICRSHGVRPWIWCNYVCVEGYGGEEAFRASIPKDVLISNWYYGSVPSDPVAYGENKSLALYTKLGQWGYEQMPTSSTYAFHLSTKLTMKYFRNKVDPHSPAGFMTAPWYATMPKYKYALLNDAFKFGKAKEAVFPDEP